MFVIHLNNKTSIRLVLPNAKFPTQWVGQRDTTEYADIHLMKLQ